MKLDDLYLLCYTFPTGIVEVQMKLFLIGICLFLVGVNGFIAGTKVGQGEDAAPNLVIAGLWGIVAFINVMLLYMEARAKK